MESPRQPGLSGEEGAYILHGNSWGRGVLPQVGRGQLRTARVRASSPSPHLPAGLECPPPPPPPFPQQRRHGPFLSETWSPSTSTRWGEGGGGRKAAHGGQEDAGV